MRENINYHYKIDMEVRDYELDMLGIVNNSVYLNYLEFARHEYLRSIGMAYNTLHEKGFNLVVTRAEIDYKASLKSGDRFYIKLSANRTKKIRFLFFQEIVKYPENLVMLKAKILGTALNLKGRPCFPEKLSEYFIEYN